MASVDPAGPVFPSVAARAGHYESFYLKANHPSEPVAVWIRYTVHKRPRAAPRGSLWFTLFDATAPGPRAMKVTTEAVDAKGGAYVRIGDAHFAPGSVVGAAAEVSWELAYEGDQDPLLHLPKGWMYRAPLPRTKLMSPHPDVLVAGTVRAGSHELTLDGWRGMVGHNWGSRHAERWIWMHAAFTGAEGPTWLDVALGRIKVGPWVTPWVASGALCVDGVRHRVGGPGEARRTEVRETPTRCEFAIPGDEVSVQGKVSSEPGNFVGWVYADPDGSEHHTLNCSISDMKLTASRPGREPLELACGGAAAYELGMRERDHGMVLQPFPDG